MIQRPIHPLQKPITFRLSGTTQKMYIRRYSHIFMYSILLILLVHINDTRYAKIQLHRGSFNEYVYFKFDQPKSKPLGSRCIAIIRGTGAIYIAPCYEYMYIYACIQFL